jgi:hypothetical protein
MKKTQRHPFFEMTGSSGVNRDVVPEKVETQAGLIFDSKNSRRNSSSGNMEGREKIGGEEIVYPNIDNRCIGGTGESVAGDYRCVCVSEVNGNKFEIWADQDDIKPVIIRINGKIVCMTGSIPFSGNIDLQSHVDEMCIGGEVFVTDGVHLPMIFNVKDLMSNSGMLPGSSCTQRYFEDFNIDEHIVGLTQPAGRLEFVKLTQNTSESTYNFIPPAPVGLPVGYYSYAVRYATESGEKTGWSPPSVMIPVVRADDARGGGYYRSRTRGGRANLLDPSTYGIQLKFRVDNSLNYKFIEVRRTHWNIEDPFGSPPQYTLCGKFNVSPGELNVITISDFNGFEETLGSDDIGEVMAAIETAKTLRYAGKRLYMSNIKYASRVLDSEDVKIMSFSGGSPGTFFQQFLSKNGLSSPFNHAYYKNYTSREKVGYALVLFDGNGYYSYPLPIDGAENVTVPGRRDEILGDALDCTYYDPVMGANNQGAISPVFEAFSMHDAERKTRGDLWHNIINDGSKSKANISSQVDGAFEYQVPDEFTGGGLGQFVQGENVGFRPFTPVSQTDGNIDSLSFRVNLFSGNGASKSSYNPKGFNPDYYSKGYAIRGLENWPAWAKGAAIARTPVAERVAAQGIAYYAMTSAGGGLGVNTSKATNKIWLFCPDFHPSSGVTPELVQDIMSNYDNYAIEVESPLGFFSEVYSFFDKVMPASPKYAADIMTYARVIREEFDGGTPQINPGDLPGNGLSTGTENYTAFGSWRRPGTNPDGIFSGGQNNTHSTPIGIVSINPTPQYRGRGYYVEVTLNQDIYWHATSGGHLGTDDSVRRWHEPLYIVNIIRKTADVATQSTQKYFFTGQYLKFDSVIGVSEGLQPQSFELVDERWEDCVNILPGMDTANQYLSLERFLFIKTDGGERRRWLNVSGRTVQQIEVIVDEIAANGFAQITDASGFYQVYGVYRSTVESTEPLRVFIDFSHISVSRPVQYFIPAQDAQIIVSYDNRMPIKVFGGDSTVGETVFAPIDCEYNANAEPADAQNDFRLNVAFPLRKYYLNPLQLIARKTSGFGIIQDENKFQFDELVMGASPARIRQLLVQFCCESRAITNFAFNEEGSLDSAGQFFPLKNYVMRPFQWNTEEDMIQNKMFQAYIDSYGQEINQWKYGGFRFLQQINIDYSKDNNQDANLVSFPSVGFVEQTEFCTRTIWSLEREMNIQNSPSVRTFPDTNLYDISDDTGGINLLHSMNGGDRGFNLFAFTQSGIFMLLIDKRTVSELSGSELATVAAVYGGVVQDIPLTRNIGIPDEFWRTKAEHSGFLRFDNRDSRYVFDGAKATDVFRGVYRSFLKKITDQISSGYEDSVAAVYDRDHAEYWVGYIKKPRAFGLDWPVISVKTDEVVNIIDQNQLPDVPPAYYNVPNGVTVSGPSVIRIIPQVDVSSQIGVILGGPAGSLLTSDVLITVPASSQFSAVLFYRKPNVFQEIIFQQIIAPGEAYLFTSSEAVYQTPYEGQAYGFTMSLYTSVSDFTPDRCQVVVDAIVQGKGIIAEGRFGYLFDKYLNVDNNVYGMRNLSTFLLNSGHIMNGEPVKLSIVGIANPERQMDKEFIFLREESTERPSSLRFYYTQDQVDAMAPVSEIDGQFLFNRQGYESYIPRDVDKNRLQKRHIFVEVFHNLAEDFVHICNIIQYKILK